MQTRDDCHEIDIDDAEQNEQATEETWLAAEAEWAGYRLVGFDLPSCPRRIS